MLNNLLPWNYFKPTTNHQAIIREATILKGRIFKNKFPKCCPLASHEGFVKFCCTGSADLTTLEK